MRGLLKGVRLQLKKTEKVVHDFRKAPRFLRRMPNPLKLKPGRDGGNFEGMSLNPSCDRV
jgi:hypothetical protein